MKRMLAVTLTAAVAAGLVSTFGARSPQGNPQPAAGAPQGGQQPTPGAPGGRAGGRGRGGPIVPPVAFEDRTGFESLFDGKSLTPGATARAAARAAAAAKQAEEAKAAAAAGQPAPTGRGRGGLRRWTAAITVPGLGRRSEVLARRERRHGRGKHARQGRQTEHLPDLEGRRRRATSS